MRAIHFLSSGGAAMFFPFLGLFYERNGLSGTEIGLLSTIGSVVALLIAPVWGRLSDGIAHPRLLLQAALIGSAICWLWLGQQTLFIWMALVVAIEALLGATTEPLLSVLTLGVTQEKSGFGSVRLWGSLGWAVAAPVAGFLIERTSIGSIFWGNAVLVVLCVLILIGLNTRPQKQPEANAPQQNTWSVFKELISDKAMIGLGLALAISWLTSAGRYQFEAIYLNQLGAAESVIGWVNTVGALVELPALLWADRLIRRYGSASVFKWCFLMEAASYIFVLVAPSVPAVFLFRIATAFAYSLYVVASVVFISERSPGGQSTTTLALYMVTLRCIIGLVSGPLNGVIFDSVGAYYLYVFAFGGSLLAWFTLRLTVSGRRSKIEA